MRAFIWISMLLVGLCSCGSTEQKAAAVLSLQEQIALKKKNELASGILQDTVILDHVFGMSKKEMYKHKNKLFSMKKIYGIFKTKNTRIFAYDVKTKHFDKLTLYFDAYFHEDEMYRMECIPKLKNNEDLKKVQSDLISLYEIKYGAPHFTVPKDTIKNYNAALWIYNNQVIEIERDDEEVTVSYIDMNREQKIVNDI